MTYVNLIWILLYISTKHHFIQSYATSEIMFRIKTKHASQGNWNTETGTKSHDDGEWNFGKRGTRISYAKSETQK